MSSRVIVSLRVAAAPMRAFDVFTRDIGVWWQPNELFRFTPRSPGKIALEPGEDGRFTETLANGKRLRNRTRDLLGARRAAGIDLAPGDLCTGPDDACRGAV